MTRMASYEAGEGKKNLITSRYFRGDYVAVEVLKSIISATICFFLVFALYVYYNFEIFMETLYQLDIMDMAKRYGKIYLITVGSYVALSYVVSTVKYAMAQKNLRHYYSNLKRLGRIYKDQSK